MPSAGDRHHWTSRSKGRSLEIITILYPLRSNAQRQRSGLKGSPLKLKHCAHPSHSCLMCLVIRNSCSRFQAFISFAPRPPIRTQSPVCSAVLNRASPHSRLAIRAPGSNTSTNDVLRYPEAVPQSALACLIQVCARRCLPIRLQHIKGSPNSPSRRSSCAWHH